MLSARQPVLSDLICPSMLVASISVVTTPATHLDVNPHFRKNNETDPNNDKQGEKKMCPTAVTVFGFHVAPCQHTKSNDRGGAIGC